MPGYIFVDISKMKAKLYSYLIILVLLIAAVWLISKRSNNAKEADPASELDDRAVVRGFRRKISYLEYTVHAKCRMQCRHITQVEVQDIMKNGTINYKKSNLNDKPCPTYALEGFTRQDNQHVRIVFGQCSQKSIVVTCIDLDKDFACNCK